MGGRERGRGGEEEGEGGKEGGREGEGRKCAHNIHKH